MDGELHQGLAVFRRVVKSQEGQKRTTMKTLEEVKAHCRFVGEGIEKGVADGEDLFARFEGTPILRFKVEREGA